MPRLPVLLALLTLLAASAAPVYAQFVVRPESARDRACRMSDRVPHQVDSFNEETRRRGDDRYTVASLRDSRGRCTLGLYQRPFDDPLYGELPEPETVEAFLQASGFAENDGDYYTMDRAPDGWAFYDVRDHLGLLAGYVAVHNGTHTYLYFHRYGYATYIAVHTGGRGSDQWALLSTTGRSYYGTTYAADPPLTTRDGKARIDERLINRFPFVYQYPFPYQPEPRALRRLEPRYERGAVD